MLALARGFYRAAGPSCLSRGPCSSTYFIAALSAEIASLPTGSGILIRWPCKGGCPLIPGRWLFLLLFLFPPPSSFSPFIYFRGVYPFFFFSLFLEKERSARARTRGPRSGYALGTSVFFGNVYFRSVLGSDYDRPRMKLVLRVDETGCGFYSVAYDGAWVEWAFEKLTRGGFSWYLWLFWWSCLKE